MRKIISINESKLSNIIADSIKKVILKEELGVFPGCKEYAVSILDLIRKKWTDEESCYNLYIPFKYCKYKYIIIRPLKIPVGAAYLFEKSKTNGNDVIAINPKALKEDDNKLTKTLMHELTHVYENYHRELSGGSLYDLGTKTAYNKASKYKFYTPYFDKEEIPEDLSEILTYLASFERNARVAGMKEKLDQQNFKTKEEVLHFLKKTWEYDVTNGCVKSAVSYANATDPLEQQEILATMNGWYPNSPFKTFTQVAKYLTNLANKSKSKFDVMTKKIASDYLTRRQIYNDVGNVNWNGERRK